MSPPGASLSSLSQELLGAGQHLSAVWTDTAAGCDVYGTFPPGLGAEACLVRERHDWKEPCALNGKGMLLGRKLM